jgi:acetolactate synthase-1/2/3 large subunit
MSPLRKTRAHALVEALERSGVTHVFGIPGTHNIELYDALADSETVSTVLITDEQSSGFMADGFARASGHIAAICLVPGAGLSHAMSGIAEAFLDQVPLLVLACGVRRDVPKRFQLHDIDQLAMVRPVCKWAGTITEWDRAGEVLQAAVRYAKQVPAGPVVVEIPAEGLLLESPKDLGPQQLPPGAHGEPLDEIRWRALRSVIAESRQMGLYVGNIGGDSAGQAKLVELADRLNAYVWTTLSAKGLYPEDDDRFLWNVAGAASPPAMRALEAEVDLWLVLGGKFGEVSTASYGFVPRGRVVHVDPSPESHTGNLPEDLSLDCDAWLVVDRLLETEVRAGDPASRERTRAARDRAAEERRAETKEAAPGRIDPAQLFRTLQSVLPPDTAYSVDSGNGMFLAMENLRLTQPRCYLAPIDFSCMGYSVPAAVGARFADPERTVVALPGDGAFLMTGLEALTGIRHGVAPIILILRDGKLSQISQFQTRSLDRETACALPDYDVSKLAEALGARHYRLADPSSLEAMVRRIAEESRAGVPVLAEAIVSYANPTWFTRGIVKTNFLRMPMEDRMRILGRLAGRKLRKWVAPPV